MRRSLIRLLPYQHHKHIRLFGTQRTSDPLRILFCGSDDFSISSLQRLHKEHTQREDVIASIDVVCRPAKRVGRGLKAIRTVPIAKVAEELSLPLHEVDTFTGWKPPKPAGEDINLIVAVSFGKLVPRRILNGAKYGGLNVHPSLLPDFHGPAPLHHTLINGCETTGVTVQTMHPDHFDRGQILRQTPSPGIAHYCQTVDQLTSLLGPIGAEMLLDTIKHQAFDLSMGKSLTGFALDTTQARAAPKITRADSRINWLSWNAGEILRKQRVIGPLWNFVNEGSCRERRAIWASGFTQIANPPQNSIDIPGVPYLVDQHNDKQELRIQTCDNQSLQVGTMKLDGEGERPAVAALRSLVKGSKDSDVYDNVKLS